MISGLIEEPRQRGLETREENEDQQENSYEEQPHK